MKPETRKDGEARRKAGQKPRRAAGLRVLADVTAISGVIRPGAAGPELVPTAGGGAPVPVPDAKSEEHWKNAA